MIDVSEVVAFAAVLKSPVIEEPWVDEWSEKVAAEMRQNVPVDTGTLRDSIQVTDDGVDVTAPYAAFVEYGTSDTAPQPYAGPAVNKLIRPAAEDLGDRVLRQLTVG